ncbi:phage tail tip lysozyme [Nonomuraea sediminis]|uniref:phage tail tip lysozyme n=1 Tax=Nonomuraea sediminis TaxID=2835864 RepID=UPI001BDDADB6|nr:phage tail tip lysozyme [Nonomuraea sediminis]
MTQPAAESILGFWRYSGGGVVGVSRGADGLVGTIHQAITLQQCPHNVGEVMWNIDKGTHLGWKVAGDCSSERQPQKAQWQVSGETLTVHVEHGSDNVGDYAFQRQPSLPMNGRVYFFRGSDYVGYDLESDAAGQLKIIPISSGWKRLPSGFQNDLDAVVNWGNGIAYFFKDDQYVRYDIRTDTTVGPQKTADHWTALPNGFHNDLDAVVNWGNGYAYFFKNDQYVRYDIGADSAVGPQKISDHWTALPNGFHNDLDAVVNWGNGIAYFFKNDQYVRYDIGADSAVGPQKISDHWTALPGGFRDGHFDDVVNWNLVVQWEDIPRYQRMLYVMEKLVRHYGYPVNGAAGLVGNFVIESYVIPSNIEGAKEQSPMRAANWSGEVVEHTADAIMNRNEAAGVGPKLSGVGLAHWSERDRRRGLFTHKLSDTALGASVLFNMDAQIDYAVRELGKSYKPVNDFLRRPNVTASDACDEALYEYEIPGAIIGTDHRRLPRKDPRVQAAFKKRRPEAERAATLYRTAHPG